MTQQSLRWRVFAAPGTSKWNKIEHRMFSFISLHGKGEPLVSYETVVQLISTTTTQTGLTIEVMLDQTRYECKQKISREAMKQLNIEFLFTPEMELHPASSGLARESRESRKV